MDIPQLGFRSSIEKACKSNNNPPINNAQITMIELDIILEQHWMLEQTAIFIWHLANYHKVQNYFSGLQIEDRFVSS
jgi:hypothetical protein